MTLLSLPKLSIADIERLQQAGDIPALIRLLGHNDPTYQWHVAEALGTFGCTATLPLIRALHSPRGTVRLGAIEALSTIKDAGSVESLIRVLRTDATSEVRWAATQIHREKKFPVIFFLQKTPQTGVFYTARAK